MTCPFNNDFFFNTNWLFYPLLIYKIFYSLNEYEWYKELNCINLDLFCDKSCSQFTLFFSISPLLNVFLDCYTKKPVQCIWTGWHKKKGRDVSPSRIEPAACYCRTCALSSPLWCLTSVFGMGTGVSITLSPPDLFPSPECTSTQNWTAL